MKLGRCWCAQVVTKHQCTVMGYSQDTRGRHVLEAARPYLFQARVTRHQVVILKATRGLLTGTRLLLLAGLLSWLLLTLPLRLLPAVIGPGLLICIRRWLAPAVNLYWPFSSCGLAEVEAAETTNRVATAAGAVHTKGNLSADRQHDREPGDVEHRRISCLALLISWMLVQPASDSIVQGND